MKIKRLYLYTILVIGILIYSVIYYFHPNPEITISFLLGNLGLVVCCESLLIGLFLRYFWKWKIFKNWFVKYPDLNGTWKGSLQSTWEDPETGKVRNPISIKLRINQTLSSISCTMFTDTMKSESFNEKINIDRQVNQLIFSYARDPKQTVREKYPSYRGTAILDIISDGANFKLEGGYWTERKTTGDITVIRESKDLLN